MKSIEITRQVQQIQFYRLGSRWPFFLLCNFLTWYLLATTYFGGKKMGKYLAFCSPLFNLLSYDFSTSANFWFRILVFRCIFVGVVRSESDNHNTYKKEHWNSGVLVETADLLVQRCTGQIIPAPKPLGAVPIQCILRQPIWVHIHIWTSFGYHTILHAT
jgi:hypothetical protein